MSKALITKQQALSKASQIVPYLMPEEVKQLTQATGNGKRGERDRLLIRACCLVISAFDMLTSSSAVVDVLVRIPDPRLSQLRP